MNKDFDTGKRYDVIIRDLNKGDRILHIFAVNRKVEDIIKKTPGLFGFHQYNSERASVTISPRYDAGVILDNLGTRLARAGLTTRIESDYAYIDERGKLRNFYSPAGIK